MNKFSRFLIGSIILISFQLYSQTIVDAHGMLHVDGTKIKDQCGRIVQLRGMSFFHHIYLNSHKYQNADCVEWLRDDWNVQILRTAIVADRGDTGLSYFENSDFALQVARDAINAAIKKGVYIIVDWHQKLKWEKEANEFFKILASEYTDTPNIIWEIWNEPRNTKDPQNDYTWNDVKPYAEKLITTIRRYSDNIIVVGTPFFSSRPLEASLDPVIIDSAGNTVSNIAYTLHFYAGTHGANMRHHATQAIENGLCLMVTECGSVPASGDGEDDWNAWNEWVAWMDQYDISWCKWSLGVKDEGASTLIAGASYLGNWDLDKNLTNSGRHIREYFRNNNSVPDSCNSQTSIEIKYNQPAMPSFKVFPNPAKDELNIDGSGNYRIALINIRGRVVAESDYLSGFSSLSLNNIAPGRYFIRIHQMNKFKIQKLTVYR